MIIATEGYFIPLVEHMKTLLLQELCIHADGTPVKVMHERNRSNKSKSYMWLFASGAFATTSGIRLFHYAPTRSGQVAVEVLGKYSGFVQTDDFAGYNKLTQVEPCLCWAHVRRKLVCSKKKR